MQTETVVVKFLQGGSLPPIVFGSSPYSGGARLHDYGVRSSPTAARPPLEQSTSGAAITGRKGPCGRQNSFVVLVPADADPAGRKLACHAIEDLVRASMADIVSIWDKAATRRKARETYTVGESNDWFCGIASHYPAGGFSITESLNVGRGYGKDPHRGVYQRTKQSHC